MIKSRVDAPIGVQVRELTLTCDRCGAAIAHGGSRRAVRRAAAEGGYRRLDDEDVCGRCAVKG